MILSRLIFFILTFLILISKSYANSCYFLNKNNKYIIYSRNSFSNCTIDQSIIEKINNSDYQNKDTLINILGNAELATDIKFNSKDHHYTLQIGTLYNTDYIINKLYTENVQHEIEGIANVKLYSINAATVNHIDFINVQNLELNGFNIYLSNVNFINTNTNMIFNLRPNTLLYIANTTFNLKHSNLTINIENANLLDDPLIIKGDQYSTLNLNILATDNKRLLINSFSQITSEVSTNFSMKNIKNLKINSEVNFNAMQNQLNIENSTFNGNINFNNDRNTINLQNVIGNGNLIIRGNTNNITLNNVNLTNLKILSNYNQINLSGKFNSLLYIRGSNNTLAVDEYNISSPLSAEFNGNLSRLNLVNSSNIKQSDIKFIFNSTNNNVYLNSGIINSHLVFNNHDTNNLYLGKSGNTEINGNNISNNKAKLNLYIYGKHSVHLKNINFKINNILVENNSNIVIPAAGITANSYIQMANANININLDKSVPSIITTENADFNNGTLHIYVTNVSKLNLDRYEEYTILTSSNQIINLPKVVINGSLLHYKIVVDDHKIIITPIKYTTINNFLANNLYVINHKFYDINSITKTLDNLWEKNNNTDISKVLDNIINISNDNQAVATFIDSLFPINNSILYLLNANDNIITINLANNLTNTIDDNKKLNIQGNYYSVNNQIGISSLNNKLNSNGYGYLININYNYSSNFSFGMLSSFIVNKVIQTNENISANNYFVMAYMLQRLPYNGNIKVSLGTSIAKYNTKRYIVFNQNKINLLATPKINNYILDLYSNYSINLLKLNKLELNIIPYLESNFHYSYMNNYSENNDIGVIVKGFKVNNFTNTIGVNINLPVYYNSSVITPKFTASYNYSMFNLPTTIFAFRGDVSQQSIKIIDNNFYSNYYNFISEVSYATLNNNIILKAIMNNLVSNNNIVNSYGFAIQYNL
ncbi:autotransporter domain-containing protein [Rickettsiales bacterium LUAb2]